jgi:hypothetical protein
MSPNRLLHKRKPELGEEAYDPTTYQSMIESLMYAIATTRPDSAFAIGVLSRYNHDPSNEHMVALKRVFRYLNGTKDWRLRFGGVCVLGEGALGGESELKCYVDSDYAGCPDDYKSTSGLVITFGGVVDWRLRKQNSTAQSTTDAEYYAFGVGSMRLAQISHHLNELGIPTIPRVFFDSVFQHFLAGFNLYFYNSHLCCAAAYLHIVRSRPITTTHRITKLRKIIN